MKKKIEVWSDINCPFCYIGKRHLEKAIAQSEHPEDIQVEWKSFELDPMANPPAGADNAELLAKKYGKSRAWADEMNHNMTQMAAKAGLNFNMQKVKPANSFNAHRLLHLAKGTGQQNELKERLLAAKFSEGVDINDPESLVKLGVDVGLKAEQVRELLDGTKYSKEVREDEEMAAKLGISGVPFFVLNSQYSLSGAQPIENFKEVLARLN